MRCVLAIDPGRQKCGVAIVGQDGVIHKEIIPRDSAPSAISALAERYAVDTVIIGNGTGSAVLMQELQAAGITVPVEVVEEAYSTLKARERFFSANPPRGFRRLIPRGLLTPDTPYDDFVAVILAEDYLGLVGRS